MDVKAKAYPQESGRYHLLRHASTRREGAVHEVWKVQHSGKEQAIIESAKQAHSVLESGFDR
jgi:hypothetical protein